MRYLLSVIALILTFSSAGNHCQADSPIYSVSSATDLTDCVAGLTEDSTVCLLADIEETVTVRNDHDITITIDGGNHTLQNGLIISNDGNCNYVLSALNISPMDKGNDEYASTCLYISNYKGQNEVVLMNNVSFLDGPGIAIHWDESYGNGILRIENVIEAQGIGIYIEQDIDENNSSHVTVCGCGEISTEGHAPIICKGSPDIQEQIQDQDLSVSVQDLSLKGGNYTISASMTFQRMNLTITDIRTDKPVIIRWDENYVIDAKDTNAIKNELAEHIICTADNKPCEVEILYSGDTNDTSEEYSGSFVMNK